MATSLYSSVRLGDCDVQHRIALAPLTRLRADDNHVPLDIMVKYYEQRSSIPGTFLVSEATVISPNAGMYANVPGIWNQEQITAWKKVSQAVHANKSFIFLQIWALGRTSDPVQLAKDTESAEVVSSGDIPIDGVHAKPRPLTKTEIDEYVELFATAARNAVFGAGFDGVEIHGAYGYLIDQFTQDVSNNRVDEYGGSIDNRIRFALRVVDAVTDVVGSQRTAIRLSPFELAGGMGMSNPYPTFTRLITELKSRKLAYLHLVESRVKTATVELPEFGYARDPNESLQFARNIWAPRPIVLAGGYTPEDANKTVQQGFFQGEDIVIAFGRHFLANPDLPFRIQNGIPLNAYQRSTFYTPKDAKGYIDYTFASAFEPPRQRESLTG